MVSISTHSSQQPNPRPDVDWLKPVHDILNLKDRTTKHFVTDEEFKKYFQSILVDLSTQTLFLAPDTMMPRTAEILNEIQQLLEQGASGSRPAPVLALLVKKAEILLSTHPASSLEAEDALVQSDPKSTGDTRQIQVLGSKFVQSPNHVDDVKMAIVWVPTDFFSTKELIALRRVFPSHYRHWKRACDRRISPVWDLVEPRPRIPPK